MTTCWAARTTSPPTGAASEAMLKMYPDTGFSARANRAFLGRAVRYLAADAGIRQFLDIGAGIPTAGNTHEVAQAIAPESRVVYVDHDPGRARPRPRTGHADGCCPSGSYLAVSHGASDLIDQVALQGLYDSFKGKVRQQFQWRTREQVARFFTGMDLVEPGLVRVDDWRKEPGADGTRKSAMWAAVGRKS